ncbi:alpha/beta hydrolase fold protein [Myxococcus stipitatus DSM 14675]|uniref:Alpha/beta hydrolase fold protein n=1 Tax=Myxococcus stipitatus (strain DSM 14675 / JCM 12634 / Mx s8) TaxID=1278073 RepID=L7UKX2_MYXSD|nr:alpha/beta hydrolase fold protein [Myxococcus stipitatus DSM 14675]
MKPSLVSCWMLVGFLLASPAQAVPTRSEHRVPGVPGVTLSVREVREKGKPAASLPPVILLHGARVPGRASFDLPVAGGSLAADLALAGHTVFVMDARGYGGSTRPAAMSAPATGRPLVSSHEVVQDVHAVVTWVKKRTRQSRVALLGWATGGHWLGMYASLHPEEVSHLVILNALYAGGAQHAMLGRGTNFEDPKRPGQFNAEGMEAWRWNTAASLLGVWDRSIPMEDKSQWRSPEVAESIQREALASDTQSGSRTPPAFRAPSGALEDSFYLATGRQLWDAASITSRVLIIRSEKDFWSRPEDVTVLQEHLVHAASVKAVVIPEATHFVHLDRPERGRDLFLREVLGFFSPTQAMPASGAGQ